MKKLLLILFLIPIIGFSQPNEAIILKAFTNSKTYKTRVYPDAGKIRSDYVTKAFYMMSELNGMATNIQFAWLGESASKFRTSTIYNYFTKLYSTVGTNDATQTTELNQPYLSGNIAPNECYAMNNPNGSSKYITHPTISFAANEAWSITTVLNYNGSTGSSIVYGDQTGNSGRDCLYVQASSTLKILLYNSLSQIISNYLTTKYIGSNTIITITGDGTSCKLYINGLLLQTTSTYTTPIILNSIFKGHIGTAYGFNGKLYAHIIRSGALTQSQVTNEYNFFRSIYPEIETVKIGTQDWATSNLDVVATPQGNVISNVTENANVEKIAGWDFTSGWTTTNITVIDLNSYNVITTLGQIYKTDIVTSGMYIKMRLAGTASVGITNIAVEGSSLTYKTGLSGTFDETFYFKANTHYISLRNTGTGQVDISTMSVQEVGWAGSTELYDGIYAQTTGTVEQKTYAAIKASAMWSYYNNDAANGAIYGKLYNWYAAKLLQMDIDYYNAANPTAPWGYRVPSSTDFTTLQTTLGGSTVAGGKMKKEGLNYWLTPNTGADNSSGFSALGNGRRLETGIFTSINVSNSWLSTTNVSAVVSILMRTFYNNSTSEATPVFNNAGCGIRLIKN